MAQARNPECSWVLSRYKMIFAQNIVAMSHDVCWVVGLTLRNDAHRRKALRSGAAKVAATKSMLPGVPEAFGDVFE